MTKVIKIDPREPNPGTIARSAEIISRGGCIVLPTRCLYGLAVDAMQPKAVERVYTIKQRLGSNPLLVLIGHPDQVGQIARPVSSTARKLMARFWPGNLTLVVPARSHLPPALTAATGTIGIRQAGHPVAAALTRAWSGPITGTSANLSGSPGCRDIKDLDSLIVRSVDLIIDCGILAGGKGSTIVDTTREQLTVLREGSIPEKELFSTL